jgi:branched-subunit amino acid ABC-type transport system permease component
MMNFLRMMGMREFPWGTLIGWAAFGLFVAVAIRATFLRDSELKLHVNIGIALVAAIVGGILGICYYVVVDHCGFILDGPL